MGILGSDVLQEEQAAPNIDESLRKKLWMIRGCEWYDDEYADCTTIRSRFHQYFVFGETLDCSQWRRDSANCYRWKNSKDVDSAKELVDSETKRRDARLDPFYNNTVWEDRTEPPKNWNIELPEWMQKENENTFLAIKAAEEKNMTHDVLGSRQSLCVIM